jgi:hypothetical protein
METNRHAIKAHRGETFTIDKVLRNKDGSPYIISNEIKNPYLLISVVDASHSQENRFFRNYWLDLQNYPRFTLNRPLDSSEISGWSRESKFPDKQVIGSLLFDVLSECTILGTFDSVSKGVAGTLVWRDSLTKSQIDLTSNTVYPFVFTSNGTRFNSIKVESSTVELKMYYDDVLVLVINKEGNHWQSESYMRMTVNIVSDDMFVTINSNIYAIGPEFAVVKDGDDYLYWDGDWIPYECRFIKTFLSYDTQDWTAQQYSYSMQLAYGIKNRDYLTTLADEYNIKYSRSASEDGLNNKPYMSNTELYRELCKLGYTFSVNYDPESPICNISTVSILPASELVILNYAQGGVY